MAPTNLHPLEMPCARSHASRACRPPKASTLNTSPSARARASCARQALSQTEFFDRGGATSPKRRRRHHLASEHLSSDGLSAAAFFDDSSSRAAAADVAHLGAPEPLAHGAAAGGDGSVGRGNTNGSNPVSVASSSSSSQQQLAAAELLPGASVGISMGGVRSVCGRSVTYSLATSWSIQLDSSLE